ncbi:MAG: DUF1178 family protein [Beijerinckiaceae bacterium]
MIRYHLLCENDHGFESWFAGSDAFDAQAARGLVSCPHCHSVKVRKALMAPAVSGTRTQDAVPAPAAVSAPAAPAARPAASAPAAVLSEKDQAMRAMLRAIRDHVQQNADHVGDRFAEEARKMHYGEIEHRSIYGEANAEEARALYEEGVEFHPLPLLPDDRN